MIVVLFGCDNKKEEQPTDWEKQDLQGFKAILKDSVRKERIKMLSTQIDAFQDITPENVFKETGCQIFKSKETCESYLLYNGNLYTLGEGFGGFGIVDLETSDFDGNGEKELLYTYSWGSGMHRSCLGYFDLSKQCEADIDISAAKTLGFIQQELILHKISNTKFKVYKANPTMENEDFTKISLKKDMLLGEIKAVENKPTLVLR